MVSTVVTGPPPPWRRRPSRRMPRSRSSRVIRDGSTACTCTPSAARSRTRSGTSVPPSVVDSATVNHSPSCSTVPVAVSRLCAAGVRPVRCSRSSRWPSSSASVPDAATRPRSRMTTRSQTRSTSPIRWELSSTATPCERSDSTRSRTSARPSGSSALVGSSSTTSSGRATSATARPSRCCMPLEKPPSRSPARSASPTRSRQSRCSCAVTAAPERRTCRVSTSDGVSQGW